MPQRQEQLDCTRNPHDRAYAQSKRCRNFPTLPTQNYGLAGPKQGAVRCSMFANFLETKVGRMCRKFHGGRIRSSCAKRSHVVRPRTTGCIVRLL